MSGKIKKQSKASELLTDQQRHIKELRASLNAPDPYEIHPFTRYKILTYFCAAVIVLVPFALYRIWCPKTEFTPREQNIWTAVILVIAIYALRMAAFR